MIVVSSLECMPFPSLCFSEYSADMDPNLTLDFLLMPTHWLCLKQSDSAAPQLHFHLVRCLASCLTASSSPDMSHLSFPTQSPSFTCDCHFVVPYGGRRWQGTVSAIVLSPLPHTVIPVNWDHSFLNEGRFHFFSSDPFQGVRSLGEEWNPVAHFQLGAAPNGTQSQH